MGGFIVCDIRHRPELLRICARLNHWVLLSCLRHPLVAWEVMSYDIAPDNLKTGCRQQRLRLYRSHTLHQLKSKCLPARGSTGPGGLAPLPFVIWPRLNNFASFCWIEMGEWCILSGYGLAMQQPW